MEKIIEVLDRVLEYILVIIFGLLVINVLWQVFSRFVLANPSSFTDELARFLLIWLSLFGAAYVLGKRLHLSIDLISHKLNAKQTLILDVLVQLSILVFVATVLLIGGSRLVFVTLHLNQTSAALGVPLGYVYAVLPLCGLIMGFYTIHFLMEDLAKLKSKENN
ncbi:MAG: TRAP transporter small permease [Balneolales bacterium]|nr:TRAP transporter small permease [Balneolales bacterium]